MKLQIASCKKVWLENGAGISNRRKQFMLCRRAEEGCRERWRLDWSRRMLKSIDYRESYKD